jgi:HrpA-like RNA helicase
LVGYNLRLDRAVSDEAQIVYCTVGILVRMLICPQEANDEEGEDGDQQPHVPLSHISHVVIDEVHERDLNTDFALTLLRLVLATNKNVRIILMSATASADLFVRYFRSDIGMEPTVIEIPGRSYPVDIKWIMDCEQAAASRVQGWSEKKMLMEQDNARGSNNMNSNKNDDSQVALSPRAATKIDNHFLRDLIGSIVREQQTQGKLSTTMSSTNGDGRKAGFRKEGAVLVFLPGKAEIESLAKVLYDDSNTLGDRDFCKILKLHSSIPRGEQQAVFRPAKNGTVKVVLATNIAETSITISGAFVSLVKFWFMCVLRLVKILTL